jgi:plastocyanin
MFLDKKRKLPKVVFLTLLTSLALVLAACQPVEMGLTEATPTVPVGTPTAPLIPETGVTPSVDQVPSVEVSDQEIRNGTVTVDRVYNPGLGWIVIHADEDGDPGPVIGYAAVMEVSEDVTVDIEVENATERLHAMLHRDAGTVGEYEFPGDDQPVFVNDEIVNVPFRVTGGLEDEDAAEDVSDPEFVPSVEVSDQEIVNDTVTVDRVRSIGAGWIVIHADEDGSPGPVIGHAPVMDLSEDVTVDIELENATERLHAMLHEDAGTIGEYEFPGDDQPVFVNDEIVNVPFRVTGGLEDEDATEDVSAGVSEVTIADSRFQPREITISTGTTVEWTQTGSLPHTVTADDGAFDSGTLQRGDTFQHTFDELGRYPYHCEIHGAAGGIGMAGVIVVEDQ